ncbi:MAG: mucoidy inhibitor MuiA family protein [Spirochaetales bacterium]|nr:mucoidy inhibitor MuiA family protein [Spirochaetales bacterium]
MNNLILSPDQTDLTCDSRVEEIVVYSRNAEVSRVLEVKLPRGETQVVFRNLGSGIDEQSIKASLESDKARIVFTTLSQNHLYFFKEEESRKVWNGILKALHELIGLEDEHSLYSLENQLIQDIKSYIQEALNDILLTQENSIVKLKEALEFLESKLKDNVFSVINVKEKIEKLAEKIGYLRAELEKTRDLDHKVQNNIEVVIQSEEEIAIPLRIRYLISGVRWRPSYDARLDTATGRVSLQYFGEISQSTGELWNDVKIVLSTSQVEKDVSIPPLYPVYLSGHFEKREKQLVVEKKAAKELAVDLDADELETGEEGGEEEDTGTVPGEAAVVSEKKGASYTFTVNRKYTVPPDGLWHKTTIIKEDFEAETVYETVPEVMEYVYLKATVKNSTDLPFLPGRVAIFRNESYMGHSSIKYIAPQETFSLSFGIDEDLRVKRIKYKDHYKEATGLASRHMKEWMYKIKLNNFKKEKKRVLVKESIYVSELKEAEVKVLETTTKDYIMNTDGILTWELELEPDPYKFREIVLSYQLSWLKNFNLSGIL